MNFGVLALGMEGKGKGMNSTVVIMEYCGLLADDVGLKCGLEYWNPVADFPKTDRKPCPVGRSTVGEKPPSS